MLAVHGNKEPFESGGHDRSNNNTSRTVLVPITESTQIDFSPAQEIPVNVTARSVAVQPEYIPITLVPRYEVVTNNTIQAFGRIQNIVRIFFSK